jgi:IS4 transposase
MRFVWLLLNSDDADAILIPERIPRGGSYEYSMRSFMHPVGLVLSQAES